MRRIQFSQKLKQLKNLAGRVQFLFKHPNQKNSQQFLTIHIKLKDLLLDLKYYLSGKTIKRILGTAILLFSISLANEVNAQWFELPVSEPFELTSTTGSSQTAFADLDNDGDFDMMTGSQEYDTISNSMIATLLYYENIGTATDPQFELPLENPFGLNFTDNIACPDFADLDNDGDMDLMVSGFYEVMQYFENIGTIEEPLFSAPEENPFGTEVFETTGNWTSFTFSDLNDDGDFDLIIAYSEIDSLDNYIYGIQYLENIGTESSPAFEIAEENPFETININSKPALADLDEDGDLDLILITYISDWWWGEWHFLYYENIGSINEANFDSVMVNPFGLNSVMGYGSYTFIDLDDDDDFDLMRNVYGSFVYIENIGAEPVGISELEDQKDLTIYPNPVIDLLTIETERIIKQIELTDVLGKTFSRTINGGKQVNLGDLSSGMYTLKISFEDGSYAIKKILKK